jgi:hypothetical protein
MDIAHANKTGMTLQLLDNAVAATGRAFACGFSNADEYEAALIRERRAVGRYREARRSSRSGIIAGFVFVACVLLVAKLFF